VKPRSSGQRRSQKRGKTCGPEEEEGGWGGAGDARKTDAGEKGDEKGPDHDTIEIRAAI